MRPADELEFRAYVNARAVGLRRTAYLLCNDWHLADDHVQAVLTQLFLHWSKVNRREALDGWVRTTLVRRVIDEGRRPWRRERPFADLPDSPAPVDGADERVLLRAALARLPARQRAVVVLRYLTDADVAETARLLGCTTGTVKSHTARALTTLRAALGETWPELVSTEEASR